MERFFLVLLIVGWSIARVAVAWAESDDQWHAPFGGAFSAYFTAASDYSFAGISQTKLGPAIQVGLDYRTADLISTFPVWLYLSAWGSNINFPTTGEGVELDLAAGVKFRALDRKLSFDLGYIRYLYPGIPASYAYEYGEINLNVGYNFGFAAVNGRLRYSPNSFSSSGISWNKRALLSVPLPFLRINEDISFRTYGSVGNLWVDGYIAYGLPTNEYWYWQIGLVTSAYGLDVTLAYTDTSIDPAGCGFTNYCSGRFFISVTKPF